MKVKHVALVCSSEERADRFYANLLGFQKNAPKILPRALSQALFGVGEELKIVKYQGDSTVFEIFIHPPHAGSDGRLEHTCLEVGDTGAVLAKCRDHGIEIRQVAKRDKTITFIADYDGNLFELT